MSKPNEVDEFFEALAHPLKAEMEKAREIIMAASPLLAETIKWGGPSFEFREPLATFNPRVKDYVVLIFHAGEPFVERFPFLEAGPKGRAYAKFRSMEDVERHRSDLDAIVRAFVANMGDS
jgi:hypothetical protein